MRTGLLRQASRQALRLLGAGVVLFHGKLLWDRFADGSLTDLAVLAQWLAAALLVAGLGLVYRKHGRLFHGREAAVLWILVALLHALTGMPAVQMLATPTTFLALPLGLVVVAFLMGARRRRLAPPYAAATRRAAGSFCPPTLPGHGGVAGARAPPR